MLFVTAAVACTSCLKLDDGGNAGNEMKYVDTITAADDAVLSYEYDTAKRISGITLTSADGTVTSYTVTYNIVKPWSQSFIEISCSDSRRWIMHINNTAMLDSWSSVDDDGTETLLSKFAYDDRYNGIYHVSSIQNVVQSQTSTFSWSATAPLEQRTVRTSEGQTTESAVVTYRYHALTSNMLANIDFLVLLLPEYFASSDIEPCVASAVTLFGTRSYYLPSSVNIMYEDYTDPDAVTSNRTRVFSFDTDKKGYIRGIYSEQGDTRTQLFGITYFS